MSRTEPTEYEQAELLFGCGFCGVVAGQWCFRAAGNGQFSKMLHQPRSERVQEVIRLSGNWQMLEDQWARNSSNRIALQVWRQNIYGDTTGRYDATYLLSRIDALLEQS